MFFGAEENLKILANFLRKAEAAHIEDEHAKFRLSAAQEIIGHIHK